MPHLVPQSEGWGCKGAEVNPRYLINITFESLVMERIGRTDPGPASEAFFPREWPHCLHKPRSPKILYEPFTYSSFKRSNRKQSPKVRHNKNLSEGLIVTGHCVQWMTHVSQSACTIFELMLLSYLEKTLQGLLCNLKGSTPNWGTSIVLQSLMWDLGVN